MKKFVIIATLAAITSTSYAQVIPMRPYMEQARITGVAPVYANQCTQRQVQVDGGPQAPNIGGAIVGGILGGVLGNQFGKGNGKTALAATGAVLGAAAGSQAGNGPQTQVVQDCQQMIVGYDVHFDFHGSQLVVRRPQQPYGDSIQVQVNTSVQAM